MTQLHQNLSHAEPAHPSAPNMDGRGGELHGGSLPSRPTVRSNFSSLVCCPVHHNTQHTTTLNLQDSRIDRLRVFLSRCVDEDHRDQNVVNTVDSEDMVVGATQLDEGDSFLVVSNDAARVARRLVLVSSRNRFASSSQAGGDAMT